MIVLVAGNFPADSVGKDTKVICCDGHGVPELLYAIQWKMLWTMLCFVCRITMGETVTQEEFIKW